MQRQRRGMAGLLALFAAAAMVAPALAASPAPSPAPSPTPSPSPSEPPGPEPAELMGWLDGPLPQTAAVGSVIEVGIFGLVRFEGRDERLRGGTFDLRMFPASGTAEPSFAYAAENWPGHYRAMIEVPEGGAGHVTLSLSGTFCENDNCQTIEEPIVIQGVGPPPDVELSWIATAFVAAPVETIVAGEPARLQVAVEPRIAWPEPLDLPPSLWLQVRYPQGEVVAAVEAPLAASGLAYEADVTVEQPGEYVVQVATAAEPEEDQLFGTGIRRVTVEAAPTTPSASDAPGTGEDGALPAWALPALAIAALVAAGLLVFGGRARER